MKLNVNGKTVEFDGDESTPLLWVLRDHLDVEQAYAAHVQFI